MGEQASEVGVDHFVPFNYMASTIVNLSSWLNPVCLEFLSIHVLVTVFNKLKN